MIRVHRVKLHNFMSIGDADLTFGDGKATMIVGENGSGKSSVLCAIGFAFDSYKRGSKYSDYVKKGESMATVYIEAEVGGTPIVFDITINADSSLSREITFGTEDPCVNSACDALIDRLELGYFAKVIFSMQDECDITKMSPGARAKLLSKLLNFDFSAQSKELADEVKALEAKETENRALIQANVDLIADKGTKFEDAGQPPLTEAMKDSLKAELDEIHGKIADYDEKTEENAKVTAAMDEVRRRLSPLEEDRASLDGSIRSLTDEISGIDRAAQAYLDEKARISSAIDESSAAIDAKVAECASLSIEVSREDAKVKDASLSVQEKNRAIVASTVEASTISSEAQAIKKNIAFMQQGSCPTCGADIDQSQVPELQDSLRELNARLESANETRQKNQAELASLEKAETAARAEFTAAHGRLKAAESSRDAAIKADLENKKKLEALKEPVPAKTKDALAAEVTSLRTRLSGVVEEIATLKAEIDSLDKSRHQLSRGDKVLWKSREAEIQASLDGYSAWTQAALNVEKTNARLRDEIASCEAKVGELTDLNARLALEVADRVEAREILDKDLPQYLIMKTCDSFESRINRFIQSVFPEMTIKMYQNKNGVDFFYVPTSEYETDPEDKDSWIHISMSSGMEKAALSVAWRVALAESYELDILMLDECDAAATQKSSEKLLTTVVDSPDFSQVFIVTHRKETRDALAASKDITVYYADKGSFYDFDPEEVEMEG